MNRSTEDERRGFHWERYPANAAEFDLLMRAIDKELAARGARIHQRPLSVPDLLWEAFSWGGNIVPPKRLASEPGFEGDVLMAKAHQWYGDLYGNRLNAEFGIPDVPVRLGNSLWKIQFGIVYGTVHLFSDRNLDNGGDSFKSGGAPATYNVLTALADVPQSFVGHLEEAAIRAYEQFYVFAFEAIQWQSQLPRHALFQTAKDDYAASTTDLLAGRLGQARWGAQQAIEKTIKGFLDIVSIPYPASGRAGHNLLHLGDLLERGRKVRLDPADLRSAACSPGIRYGEERSTELQAYVANHAVLKVWTKIRKALPEYG